jgi:Phosphoglucose isomerase
LFCVHSQELLFDLANAAGLKEKQQAMQLGQHINATEDRAVMHVALRAPKDFAPIVVDGENVVPAVHAVLDKVIEYGKLYVHNEMFIFCVRIYCLDQRFCVKISHRSVAWMHGEKTYHGAIYRNWRIMYAVDNSFDYLFL